MPNKDLTQIFLLLKDKQFEQRKYENNEIETKALFRIQKDNFFVGCRMNEVLIPEKHYEVFAFIEYEDNIVSGLLSKSDSSLLIATNQYEGLKLYLEKVDIKNLLLKCTKK